MHAYKDLLIYIKITLSHYVNVSKLPCTLHYGAVNVGWKLYKKRERIFIKKKKKYHVHAASLRRKI